MTTTKTIDGATYKFQRMNAMAALKLDGLGVRLLGPPVFQSLTTSKSAMEFITKMLSGDERDTDESEKAWADKFFGEDVEAFMKKHLASLLGNIGSAVELLGDRLSDSDLEAVVQLAVVGSVFFVSEREGDCLIESLKDYDNYITPNMERYGHTHQLKLIWEALRFQLGPSTAGSPDGSRPKAAGASEAG